MLTKNEKAKLASIPILGLAIGIAVIKLVELLTPILGYDFALICVSLSLVPAGLVGMLVEDAILH